MDDVPNRNLIPPLVNKTTLEGKSLVIPTKHFFVGRKVNQSTYTHFQPQQATIDFLQFKSSLYLQNLYTGFRIET